MGIIVVTPVEFRPKGPVSIPDTTKDSPSARVSSLVYFISEVFTEYQENGPVTIIASQSTDIFARERQKCQPLTITTEISLY